jgi:hypothetical protein
MKTIKSGKESSYLRANITSSRNLCRLLKRNKRAYSISSKESQMPRAGVEPATSGDITRKTALFLILR